MRYANLGLYYKIDEVDKYFNIESKGLKSLILSNALTNKNHFFDDLKKNYLGIEQIINISLGKSSNEDYKALLSDFNSLEFYDNCVAIEKTKEKNLLVYGNILAENKKYDFWNYYIISKNADSNYLVFDSKKYYYSNYYSILSIESKNECKIYDSNHDKNINLKFQHGLILSKNVPKTILNYVGVNIG